MALSNRRDQGHARVRAFNRTLRPSPLPTTDEVLAACLTFCSDGTPHTRRHAASFARNILADPHVTVLPQSHASFLDALAVYASRLDQHDSLIDGVTMQARRRDGIPDVLSNEHHFAQEGFRILFPCSLCCQATPAHRHDLPGTP
jgi:predicted nucleic acid-binding protein